MESQFWQWAFGLATTVALGLLGLMIGVFTRVYSKISRGDAALHKRIDEVKDEYVRQDHLQTHIEHISRRLDDMREESRTRHSELKEFLKDAMKR